MKFGSEENLGDTLVERSTLSSAAELRREGRTLNEQTRHFNALVEIAKIEHGVQSVHRACSHFNVLCMCWQGTTAIRL